MDVSTVIPFIHQKFSPLLLSMPVPSFKEDCAYFWSIWEGILKDWDKIERKPWLVDRANNLKQEFLRLYGIAQIKETYRASQKDHKTQGWFYRVDGISKKDAEVLSRFRWRGKVPFYSEMLGRNHPI